MITGFELRTAPLTDDEKKLVPIIIKGLSQRTRKDLAITGSLICKRINATYGTKLSGPRLRKITNFLRSEGILPVIATSNGYYVSYDEKEIRTQIESLSQRRDAIDTAINGLKKFIK